LYPKLYTREAKPYTIKAHLDRNTQALTPLAQNRLIYSLNPKTLTKKWYILSPLPWNAMSIL